MDTQVAQIADWFMGHLNHPLVIRKEEQGDTDQVFMTLQKVSYIPGNPERDDYVDEDRIVLHGDGRIAPDGDGNSSDLPRHSYEIPLPSGFRSTLDQRQLDLDTERAAYRVSLQ